MNWTLNYTWDETLIVIEDAYIRDILQAFIDLMSHHPQHNIVMGEEADAVFVFFYHPNSGDCEASLIVLNDAERGNTYHAPTQ